jgi:hypothetical protein
MKPDVCYNRYFVDILVDVECVYVICSYILLKHPVYLVLAIGNISIPFVTIRKMKINFLYSYTYRGLLQVNLQLIIYYCKLAYILLAIC